MGQKTKQRKSGRRKTVRKRADLRHRVKDVDEILEDLTPVQIQKLQETAPDPSIRGEGKCYCIACSRHFISDDALQTHFKSKVHKQQIKRLSEGGFSQRDADRAAGMGEPDNGGVRKPVSKK